MTLSAGLVKSVGYPFWLRRDGRSQALAEHAQLIQSQYFDTSHIRELKLIRLKALLEHAANNCKYYRQLFQEHSFDVNSFSGIANLERIPRLSKQTLLNRIEEMVAENIPRTMLHRSQSGGSSGRRTPFYRNNDCIPPKLAAEWRFQNWMGWNFGERLGLIWPASQDIDSEPTWRSRFRNATFGRIELLHAASLTDASMKHFSERLERKRIIFIKGFSNAIYRFALFCQTLPKPPNVKAIMCTGEALAPEQRQLFERVFNAEVFNMYSSRETGNMAAECGKCEGLHIADENVHIEVVPDEATESDGAGTILVTDLLNYGMPLIRYEIGDRGRLIAGSCACGRALSRMGAVIGRGTDLLFSTSGALVHGASLVHYVLALGTDVGQVQFIQRQFGHITVRLTQTFRGQDDKLIHLESTLRKLLGNDIVIEREFVREIAPASSGKYLVTKCEIPNRTPHVESSRQ
jgi:phenylacetate-CoA ligase